MLAWKSPQCENMSSHNPTCVGFMFVFRRYTVHKTQPTQFIRQLQTQKGPKRKGLSLPNIIYIREYSTRLKPNMTSCKITIFSRRLGDTSSFTVVIFHRLVTFRGSIVDFVNWHRPADWKKHHPTMTNKNPLVATSLADQSWVDGWWDSFRASIDLKGVNLQPL